jgi:hypothetical protein
MRFLSVVIAIKLMIMLVVFMEARSLLHVQLFAH